MGLNIYLKKCPDLMHANAQEAAYEAESSKLTEALNSEFGFTDWKVFDTLPKERKDEYWRVYRERQEPLKAAHGIDDYSHKSIETIEMDSTLYPDHYFKIGYMRSSYNESGFDSYAERLGIYDLSEIFAYDSSDDYEFVPDWQASKDRAISALKLLREKDCGYDVSKVSCNFLMDVEVTDEKVALVAFRKELESWSKNPDGFESYENRSGLFNRKGMTVFAVMPGVYEFMGRKMPCAYFVTKNDKDNWYAKALEIVIETCDYVLAQPDREHFYLGWSG